MGLAPECEDVNQYARPGLQMSPKELDEMRESKPELAAIVDKLMNMRRRHDAGERQDPLSIAERAKALDMLQQTMPETVPGVPESGNFDLTTFSELQQAL